MLKIAICDDELNTRSYLAALIRKQPCPCEITEYASADECLADSEKIDLYFLDINLDSKDRTPGNTGSDGGKDVSCGTVSALKDHAPDGIALARKLRARSRAPQPVIIFVTGYDQYVFDAFDVNAFQYLLKPIDEQKFAKVFSQAVSQIESLRNPPQKVRALTLQSASTSRTIPLDEIYYIESSNHKVVLHLKSGEITYYAKISDLEKELKGQFFRIHKGYLVNLAFVEAYSRTEATLTSKDRLFISKYKYRDFVKAYLFFLKKESGL